MSNSSLKNMSLYTVGQVLNMLVPVCMIPIFTRLISPGEYGVWGMLTVAMIVAVGLGNWGLHTAFDRFFFAYANDDQKRKKLLGSLVGFSSLCLLGICCLTFALREYLSIKLTGVETWGTLLVVVVASGVFRHLGTFFMLFYRNTEQAGYYVKYDLIRLGIATVLALIMIVGFRLGIVGLASSLLVANAGIFCTLVWKFGIRKSFAVDVPILKECLSFSWPLMTKVFMGVLDFTIDKCMVGVMVSLSALGIYGQANAIAYTVFALMASVFNVYFPKWNKALFKIDNGNTSLGRMLTEHVCITTFPAMCLILLSHEVIGLLMAPEYLPGRPLVIVLAFYYSLLAIGQMQAVVASYLKMMKFMMVVNFVRYGLHIGMNFYLIPQFGAMGAVGATLITGILSTAIYAVVLGGKYTVNYELKNLLVIYGSLAGCAVLAMCCYHSLIPYSTGLAARIGLLCIGAVIWAEIFGREKITNVRKRIFAGIIQK